MRNLGNLLELVLRLGSANRSLDRDCGVTQGVWLVIQVGKDAGNTSITLVVVADRMVKLLGS